MKHASPAFTLIELLVVISILMLLAGLAVPAVHGVMRHVWRCQTEARMHSIAMGLRTYDQIFGAFPPSDPTVVQQAAGSGDYAATGAEALAFYLRSWYRDADGTIVRGRGYRLPRLGDGFQRYDPAYLGSPDEEVHSARDPEYGFDGAAKGYFFAGCFPLRRPILYFKANTDPAAPHPLTEAHNAPIITKWLAGEAEGRLPFDQWVHRSGVVVGGTAFLLVHPGPDGLYRNGDDLLVP